MDLERRLRQELKTEARQVEASPDAWVRVHGRLGRRMVTPRRLILVLGTAAVVAVAVWVVSNQTTVKQGLVDEPSRDSFFEGYWPVGRTSEARKIQERVDGGEEQWRRDPSEVAHRYAQFLGWTLAPTAADSGSIGGSSAEGWDADTTITPLIGEGPDKQPGAEHTVTLVGLKGAETPAWFVAGIESPNITVETPERNAPVPSPVHVNGTAITFEGNVLVTVTDDAGRKLGQKPMTAGGSERTPFEGDVEITQANSDAGLVLFEGGSGFGGPSTDLTIVRVKFAKADRLTQPTLPTGVDRSASPTEPDEAFKCFFNAAAAGSFAEGKRCITDRFIASGGKDEFECCGSPPSLERAVIIKSYPQDGRLVYDSIVYWRTSTGLDSEGGPHRAWSVSVYVVREGEHWLVDASDHGGDPQPVDETTSVAFSMLAPGDTPKCDANGPTPDSFVTVTRDVPSATGAEIVLTVVREMLTGPWADEGDAAGPFPTGTRVESVDVKGNEVHVNLTDTDYRPSAACDFAQTALQRTIRTLPGFENANVTFSTP